MAILWDDTLRCYQNKTRGSTFVLYAFTVIDESSCVHAMIHFSKKDACSLIRTKTVKPVKTLHCHALKVNNRILLKSTTVYNLTITLSSQSHYYLLGYSNEDVHCIQAHQRFTHEVLTWQLMFWSQSRVSS